MENEMAAGCSACGRGWTDEPNAICNCTPHWQAYVEILRSERDEAIAELSDFTSKQIDILAEQRGFAAREARHAALQEAAHVAKECAEQHASFVGTKAGVADDSHRADTARSIETAIRALLPANDVCKRCGRSKQPFQVFCGAGCSVLWEMGDRDPGPEP